MAGRTAPACPPAAAALPAYSHLSPVHAHVRTRLTPYPTSRLFTRPDWDEANSDPTSYRVSVCTEGSPGSNGTRARRRSSRRRRKGHRRRAALRPRTSGNTSGGGPGRRCRGCSRCSRPASSRPVRRCAGRPDSWSSPWRVVPGCQGRSPAGASGRCERDPVRGPPSPRPCVAALGVANIVRAGCTGLSTLGRVWPVSARRVRVSGGVTRFVTAPVPAGGMSIVVAGRVRVGVLGVAVGVGHRPACWRWRWRGGHLPVGQRIVGRPGGLGVLRRLVGGRRVDAQRIRKVTGVARGGLATGGRAGGAGPGMLVGVPVGGRVCLGRYGWRAVPLLHRGRRRRGLVGVARTGVVGGGVAAVAVPVGVGGAVTGRLAGRSTLAVRLGVLPGTAVGAAVGGRVRLEGERRAGQRVVVEGAGDGRRCTREPGEHGQVAIPRGARPGCGASPRLLRPWAGVTRRARPGVSYRLGAGVVAGPRAAVSQRV